MLFRRHLFLSYLVLLPLLGGLSYVLVLLARTQEWVESSFELVLGLLLFCFLACVLFFWSIQRPFRKVLREMKALLTGRSYHRILTTKQDEVGVLAHFFNEVTRSLESISGDMKIHKRIRKELDSAQEIQELLIPKQSPQMKGLSITAKTRPASEIGGDTFDFYKKGDRSLIYIGDSTGHGIPAGIVMVMVDALLETFIDLKDSLTEILITLNKYLKPHLKPTMFMTMILLEWLPQKHALRWAGAGHEYLIHVQTSKKLVNTIKAGGLAVGMLPDNTPYVSENEVILEKNDFVVLYSDGIVEAMNANGEIYGLKRLCAFIGSQMSEDLSTEVLFQKIAVDVGRFMQGAMQLDDMTLIVLKHTPEVVESIDTSTDWQSSDSPAA